MLVGGFASADEHNKIRTDIPTRVRTNNPPSPSGPPSLRALFLNLKTDFKERQSETRSTEYLEQA
jgi:hypothetical protein